MSLFGDYVKERTTKSILEDDISFAVFSFPDSDSTLFIEDFFVDLKWRKQNKGRVLFGKLLEEGRRRGAVNIACAVDPEAKNALDSVKAVLAVGFKPLRTSEQRWFFIRAIGSK